MGCNRSVYFLKIGIKRKMKGLRMLWGIFMLWKVSVEGKLGAGGLFLAVGGYF
ncbi:MULTISPECIES: hypothetical protein [unclassified Bartonella]|uniref:hypothetical protein n=1 Tax=unclassified Bartonella TaxID=2645622 RepID=UPI0035CFCE96